MKVLFATWAWPTHLYPMVPLAWAFRNAGHDVRVASQPALAGTIRACGLPPVVVGVDTPPPAQIMAEVRRREYGTEGSSMTAPKRQRLAVSVRMAEAMVDGLLSVARGWAPDVIVYEPTTYAAPLVAAVTGIPALRHLWGVDVHVAARPHEAEAFAPLCKRLGIEEFTPAGTATLDPCPPRLQLDKGGPRIPMRYVPYNGSGTMPRWLLDGPVRRRICVTGGLSLSWRAASGSPAAAGGAAEAPAMSTACLVHALRGLDAEVIVAVSPADRAALGDQPPGVRVVEMLPLHLVLGGCDLVVSRGGNGTLMTAVATATPQLCIPGQRADWASARALARTGAGEFADPGLATPDDIRAAAQRVLDDRDYQDAAWQLRDEAHARPAPAQAVRHIEGLVGAGRTGW
jgi:UDP:flavonoid glycosyltransferase YjiC (YdhE family)